MRVFGKRTPKTNLAWLVQPDAVSMSCRVLERSPRMLFLSLPAPAGVTEKFKLLLNDGDEAAMCELSAMGPNYVVARISEVLNVATTSRRTKSVSFRHVVH